MPDIRRRHLSRIRYEKFFLAAWKIAFQVHRAARLLDAAARLERNRAGEHDFPRRRQVERNDRRAMAQWLKDSGLHRALLCADPPDLVFLVVGRWRETV